MNFLLHRFLAARDLGSEIAGIGAMLPDLWRMVDRRVRPMSGRVERADSSEALASLLAGIEHHLDVDRWFHAAPAFIEGERRTAEAIRAGEIDAPKIGLFAHVAWELCLDGALVRREGLEHTLRTLRTGFDAVGGELAEAAVSVHHFDRFARPLEERRAFVHAMRGLLGELTGGRLIGAYQTGGGVARRIDGIRTRLGLARLTDADRGRLGDVFAGIDPFADAALAMLTGANRPPPIGDRQP